MADLGSTRVYGDLTVTRSLTVAGKNVEDSLDERVLLTDTRLSDAREWTADTVAQAEAEAGSATARRAWTAERVRQAIAAWWAGSDEKIKLDGIQAGAQANVGTNISVSGTGGTRTIESSTGSSATITFTAADVGAAPASHGHDYLPTSGGVLSGPVGFGMVDHGAASGSKTIDFSTGQKHFLMVSGGSATPLTLTLSFPPVAAEYKLVIMETDSDPNGTPIIWPASGALFFGGTAPDMNVGEWSATVVSIFYDGAGVAYIAGGAFN